MILNINLSQRIVLGICTFLAVLTGFTLLYGAWHWYQDWQLTHQSVQTETTISAENKHAALIAALPDAHLFGKSITKSGDVPITNLQLAITGIVKVFREHGNAASKAYISISGQPSKIYQVGDNLPYGVKIYDIASDSVMLENDGKLEKLPLKREPLQFKPRQMEG